jgi:transcriptional regulator with XRE-family HTH domain
MQGHEYESLGAYLVGTGQSQSAFARRLKVGQSAVCQWIRGQRIPRPELALRIHQLTGVPLSALLRQSDSDSSEDGPITDLKTLPPRLTAHHMQRLFEIRSSRFYVLLNQGKFDRFEILPRVGRRAWSRDLVEKYLAGEGNQRRLKSR